MSRKPQGGNNRRTGVKHGCKSCQLCQDFREAQTALTLSSIMINSSSVMLVRLWPHPPPSPPLCCFIFFRSSLFLSVAVGVSVKEPYKQSVSESAEILMVPGVGGWYRACVVTVQRVPSRHQALLAELVNEKMAVELARLSFVSFCALFCFCVKLLSPCLTTSTTPPFYYFGFFVFFDEGAHIRKSSRATALGFFPWEDKEGGAVLSVHFVWSWL